MKNFSNYGVRLLVITCYFPPGCEFASDDWQSPSYNLYKAGESFDFFLEINEHFLVGPVVFVKREEKFLQVLDV